MTFHTHLILYKWEWGDPDPLNFRDRLLRVICNNVGRSIIMVKTMFAVSGHQTSHHHTRQSVTRTRVKVIILEPILILFTCTVLTLTCRSLCGRRPSFRSLSSLTLSCSSLVTSTVDSNSVVTFLNCPYQHSSDSIKLVLRIFLLAQHGKFIIDTVTDVENGLQFAC